MSRNPFHQSFAVIKRFPSGFTWPTFNTEPSAHLTTSEFVYLLNIAAPGWNGRLVIITVVVVKSWSWRACELGRWMKRGFFRGRKGIKSSRLPHSQKEWYLMRKGPISSTDGICWHCDKMDEGILCRNHRCKWNSFSRSLRHRNNLGSAVNNLNKTLRMHIKRPCHRSCLLRLTQVVFRLQLLANSVNPKSWHL